MELTLGADLSYASRTLAAVRASSTGLRALHAGSNARGQRLRSVADALAQCAARAMRHGAALEQMKALVLEATELQMRQRIQHQQQRESK